MNRIKITIDLHPSGCGFQIAANDGKTNIGYPEPVKGINEALAKAFTLRAIVEHELNIKIPDINVRVTQRAIEYNAMNTPSNRKVYADMITGKIKPQN